MDTLTIGMVAVCAVCLFLSICSFYYTFKTKKRYEKIALKLGNGEDITHILKEYTESVEELRNKDDQIIEYFKVLDHQLATSIRKVGLYRFDSYNNTRNKLSFALALLDKDGNGVILNSIYGVDDSNVYAKPIIKGKSKYNLSFEEEEAIKIALEN